MWRCGGGTVSGGHANVSLVHANLPVNSFTVEVAGSELADVFTTVTEPAGSKNAGRIRFDHVC